MSSAQKYTESIRAKHRDPSADKYGVPSIPVPSARQIPLPEFYPTERTSTASFKAPVTAAGRKKLEAPPPPAPGTLTTAMSYISSPVKYFSSIFTAAPPTDAEPAKPKERLFKIDLEKEKEKQASPKMSNSAKTLQGVVVEEVVVSTKVPQPSAEKIQGSAWRRKNMMDYGVYLPLSPKPAPKFRAQSPKRITTASSSIEMSPTTFNQMTIATSSKQNSYKVMSKVPPEEPEKKKKKDPRKLTNTNLNKSKYTPIPPTRLNVPPPRDEYPIIPFPTVLPPRIPPATYSIRSNNPSKHAAREEEAIVASDVDPPGDQETEAGVTTALSTPNDCPELVTCASPTSVKAFAAAGLNESSNVDGDQELLVQETLGKADIGDVFRVSRLDQLPSGRLSGPTSLKNLFPDAKLMNGRMNASQSNAVLPSGRVGAMDLVLCSSTTKYSSPTRASTKKAPTSPTRKPASPIATVTTVKETHPVASALDKEASNKIQPQAGILMRSNRSSEGTLQASRSKEIVSKRFQSTGPPQTSKESPRKTSPLRVEDKHLAAVEENLGRPLDNRRSRLAAWNKSFGKDERGSGVNVKPNVIVKKSPTRGKEQSLDKLPPSNALGTAAVAAATAAAAAAVTSAIQPAPEEEKVSKVPRSSQGDQTTRRDHSAVPPRSPTSSWKMESDRGVSVASSSPSPPSPKTGEDLLVHTAPDSSLDGGSKTKRSVSGAAKDFVKNKIFHTGKEKEPLFSTQETANKDAGAEVKDTGENERLNCLENYCGDPTKFFNAATMMGEIP